MKENAMNRISELFASVVGMEPPRGEDTLPDDVRGWDSLAHIRLVHAIEREFGCELPEGLLLVGKPLGDLVAAVQDSAPGA
ncbi:MAG: acyl carrier protein [Terracidiphilus sp.]